jgi:hypothetical protein
MSQNGPYSGQPWSRGSSGEPYSEPADPWSDHGSGVPDPAWGAHPPSVPHRPVSYPPSAPVSGSSGWTGVPPSRPKRNTPIVALVVTLSVLICVGLGATAWLLKVRSEQSPQAQQSPTAAAANPGPAPAGSEDARYNVKVGDCVLNEGTDQQPEMRTTSCAAGTYRVLARIRGKTTGERDAEAKCAKVRGYTKWYFYDSGLDDLDFVLCLREA